MTTYSSAEEYDISTKNNGYYFQGGIFSGFSSKLEDKQEDPSELQENLVEYSTSE